MFFLVYPSSVCAAVSLCGLTTVGELFFQQSVGAVVIRVRLRKPVFKSSLCCEAKLVTFNKQLSLTYHMSWFEYKLGKQQQIISTLISMEGGWDLRCNG